MSNHAEISETPFQANVHQVFSFSGGKRGAAIGIACWNSSLKRWEVEIRDTAYYEGFQECYSSKYQAEEYISEWLNEALDEAVWAIQNSQDPLVMPDLLDNPYRPEAY